MFPGTTLIALWLGMAPAAVAEEKAASAAGEGRAHALTIGARAGTPGYGGVLGYRLRLRYGIGVGAEFEGAFAPKAIIGGYAAERNEVYGARLPLFFPVHRSRALTMALTFSPGVRVTRSLRPGFATTPGIAVTLDVGAMAYLRPADRLTWVAGVIVPVSIQVDPIADLDRVGTLLVTGPVVPIVDRLSWFATVSAGGIFGSGGDGSKVWLQGTTGLRVVWGASAHAWRAF